MRVRLRNVIDPRPWAARAALAMILAAVSAAVLLGRLLRGRHRAPDASRRHPGTLLALAGFDNPNWARAHLSPFHAIRSVRRVVLVCHGAAKVGGVTVDCAPHWLVRTAGRSLAKIIWAVHTAIRRRPDVLVGYHIMPNALICLAIGAVLGSKVIYQMTGGPVQLSGGGYRSEAGILRSLARPSYLLESWMLWIARQFDAIVVRGEAARSFLRSSHVTCPIAVITAGIDTRRFSPNGSAQRYDLVTVARLVPVKRLDRFLELVSALARFKPTIRAAVVGDGPLRTQLQAYARQLGLNGRVAFLGAVDDVPSVLRQSQLFVLTSESEGLSIAMLEAMATGVPPVVPPVGELTEFVVDGRTGVIIDPARPPPATRRVLELLNVHDYRRQMSRAARASVVRRSSIAAVGAAWESLLRTVLRVDAEGAGSKS